MKKRKNLYFFDDISIFLSYILALVAVFRIWPLAEALIAGSLSLEQAGVLIMNPDGYVTIFIIVSALILQVLGRSVRRKERDMLKMIDTILLFKSLSLGTLAHNSHIPEEKLKGYLKAVTDRNFLPVSFDGVSVHLDTVPAAPGTEADSSGPPVQTQLSRGEIEQTIDRLKTPEGKEQKPFNVFIFLFLFVVFWPLAFIYLMRFVLKNSARQAMMEKLEMLKQSQGREKPV